MLTGTFYEFSTNGTLRTNFPSELEASDHPFKFDGRTITLTEKDNISYTIDTLTHSTLVFSTTYSNFPFKLAFLKMESGHTKTELY